MGAVMKIEVGTVHVVGVDHGACVRGGGLDFDVAHLEPMDVAEVEAVGGENAEHAGFGIRIFLLRDLDPGLVLLCRRRRAERRCLRA